MTAKLRKKQPKALIIGSSGQDGYYLSELLRGKGYSVTGLDRNNGIDHKVDICDRKAMLGYLDKARPDHIYFLAAYHRSTETESEDLRITLDQSIEVHVKALLNVLEGVECHCPGSRLFYAGSSHVFGEPLAYPQNEQTPFNPDCPYGITKAMGMNLCRLFRKERRIFASCGILFNHESPRRSPQFISRKIARGVVDIDRGRAKKIILGDLSAAVDWGAAEDYVKAMYSILCLNEPDDFVVATGKLHTVSQFAEIAFKAVGLNSELYLIEKPGLIRKNKRTCPLVGDATKIYKKTGWIPSIGFEDLVTSMVRAELANG